MWPVIKLVRLEDFSYYYPDIVSDEEHDSDGDEDKNSAEFVVGGAGSRKHLDHCKNCPSCVYLLLIEYNMLVNSFTSIGLAYRYLLTLSVTQVACERSFSALKVIKSHLRSRLSQGNLEALMTMKVNYHIVQSIDTEYIIDKVANHYSVYGRILKF